MAVLPIDQRKRIRILQVLALLVAALMLFSGPLINGEAHEVLETMGVGLVLACIAGRMWSILFIGSRKNRELVTSGPYSMTRNPLYFFSTIGAAGIGLMLGSIVAAGVFALGCWLVLGFTARREADYLRSVFGAQYDAYAQRTPIFWPQLSLYREPAEGVFSPAVLRRTFVDGLAFLSAFPLIELVEHLQASGYLPVLYRLL